MDLYCSVTSPPCRSIFMTAKALGIELNKKLLNTKAGEHLTPEFLKLNPQHTIPTLVDGDFSIWESRAIIVYLVEKYGKENDALYPRCPKKRALINQRLYFDMGTLFKSVADYYHALRDKKPADPERYKKMEVAMDFLNTFLEGNQYVAGATMTLADLSLLATVCTFEVIDFDLSKYANVARWYAHIQTVAPGAEENKAGCLALKKMIASYKS